MGDGVGLAVGVADGASVGAAVELHLVSLPPSVTKPSLHSQDHFFVQANCRFMPQASFPSVRDAVTCFPDTSIAKVSGYVCPPIQFADDTLAGHSRPISADTVFTNRLPTPEPATHL